MHVGRAIQSEMWCYKCKRTATGRMHRSKTRSQQNSSKHRHRTLKEDYFRIDREEFLLRHSGRESLASLSELGIQCCRELWCRSQRRLGSQVAVAVAVV